MNKLIKWSIYPVNVIISFGTNKKELLKYLKTILNKEDCKYVKTIDFNSSLGKTISIGPYVIIWLKKKPKNIHDLSVLNHEIYHTVCFILNRVGIKYCNKSEESYAYLIGHITNKIYKHINIKFKKEG